MILRHEYPNAAPEGARVRREEYETITDNWGNVYVSTGGFAPPTGHDGLMRWHHFYTPAEPLRRGEGERKLRLVYSLQVDEPAPGNGEDSVTRTITLEPQEVVAPLNTADEVNPKYRAKYWSDEAKRMGRIRHLREYADALTLWDAMNEALVVVPDTPKSWALLVGWKHRLLRDHGRAEQAHRLMEDQLLPKFLADPIRHLGALFEVGEHLHRRLKAGDHDAVLSSIALLRQARDKAVASGEPSALRDADYVFKNGLGFVPEAMDLPDPAVKGRLQVVK